MIRHTGKALSIFNEETADTTFMCKMKKRQIKETNNFAILFSINFYLKVIPNDAVKLEIGPHLKALLSG